MKLSFYLKIKLVLLLSLTLTGSSNSVTKAEILESIKNYPGQCPCPYSIMKNGKKCGKNSAYSKKGGYDPLCYTSDLKKNVQNVANVKVIDGDTINLNGVKFRLYGIDSPELNQKCKINNKSYRCGLLAKNFLESIINTNDLNCEKINKDRYSRIIAKCYSNKKDLNRLMVKNGWALAYTKYSNNYVDDQTFAKKNKLGIWEGKFINPETWRMNKRKGLTD